MTEPPPSRRSSQRAAVADALENVDGFRSAQELHNELRRSGQRVGLATVYRALQSFVASGEVDSVLNEDGEAIYRRCDSEAHHHHLVCRSCGLSIELPSDEVEKWATKLARRHRFTSVVHVAELFGLCRACSR